MEEKAYETRDYEAEAREQGWVDRDAWKGDPNKHTNAQTFVERGEKIAGILKNRLDKQDAQIKGLQESNRQFGEYHKQTLDAQKRQNAEKVASLEGQLAQAITDGDGAAYTRVNREINDLKVDDSVPNDAGAWDQLAQGWANENPWYNENPKLRRYADGLSDEIRAQGFNGKAYFTELTRQIQEDFPDDFKNPNKDKASNVESEGQLSVTDSKDKTYDNLPAAAKRACDDFVKQGFMTRESYVETYEFEE